MIKQSPVFSTIAMPKAPLGTKGRTAKQCPESGVWLTVRKKVPRRITLVKGERFPPHKGEAVTWILERYTYTSPS